MPKLLQIDSCLNMFSTGRITESIGRLAIKEGWEVYIIHGARYVKKGSCMHSIQAVSKLEELVHYAESLLFDKHGLSSRKATKRIIECIKTISPDVIQLHCIHGYFINYQLLFEFINSTTIPVVWTFHDCWAFTGHCAHFVMSNCFKWRDGGCHNCPRKMEYPKSIIDGSKRNYRLKQLLFSNCLNLHIVAVSKWLASFVSESFFSGTDIKVINNGVDINVFIPCSNKSSDYFTIIGVASSWDQSKGLFDFYAIRKLLPLEYKIVLVGLTEKQIKELPSGIKGFSKTNSIKQLAELYSQANVMVNPTYADSFPTVNMEALACGTPVITYNTGGSPEIIDAKTGVVVEQGDVQGLVKAIIEMKEHPLSSKDCRDRAINEYDKDKRFADYINLYESLIKK